jgi:hypothetical protein
MLILVWACVPSAQATPTPVPTVDLSTAGSFGFINGAYFEQDGGGKVGSGVSDVFLKLSTNDAIEQGYNTDGRPFESSFDMEHAAKYNRSLLLSDVPIVNKGGIDYREFRLDISQNQSGTDALLSLDRLQIFLASAKDLTGYPALGTKIFDLDTSTADNWILLNADLTAGGGKGEDMLAFIPDHLFVGDDYVYLYSKFGEHYGNNDGPEEWSVGSVTPTPPVPAPGALLLVALGSPLAVWLRRRQRA